MHNICPGLGLGRGPSPSQRAQLHSQLPQHHHQAPLSLSNIPWGLLELLPRLICASVLSISFSSFSSTTPWTWAAEENVPALVTDAHSGTERLEHSSDQKMLWHLGPRSVAQWGGCNQTLPGSALTENDYYRKGSCPPITLYYLWPNDCPLTSRDYTFLKMFLGEWKGINLIIITSMLIRGH